VSTIDTSKTFDHFPKKSECPICNSNKDAPFVLVLIHDTEDGGNVEAAPVHVKCAEFFNEINAGANTMHTDVNTAALNQYQGTVDQLAEQDAALEKYRADFSEKLMQEYTEDNHKLSWQVAEWLGEESTLLEGYLFSALTDTDFNVGEIWRDWLTERFDDMASAMSSKEIDEYQQEYF